MLVRSVRFERLPLWIRSAVFEEEWVQICYYLLVFNVRTWFQELYLSCYDIIIEGEAVKTLWDDCEMGEKFMNILILGV